MGMIVHTFHKSCENHVNKAKQQAQCLILCGHPVKSINDFKMHALLCTCGVRWRKGSRVEENMPPLTLLVGFQILGLEDTSFTLFTDPW